MTTTTIICLALLGVTGVFTAGTWFGKSHAVSRDIGTFTSLIEERDAWMDTSEKYKAIAESHDVKLPEKSGSKFTWEAHDVYQYDNSIEKNIEDLRVDLEELSEGRYRASIKVLVIGQWTLWLMGQRSRYSGDNDLYTEAPKWDFDNPGTYSKFQRLDTTFEGKPLSIASDIEKHIKNPYWGFWVGGVINKESGEKEWGYARNSGGIRIIVTLEKRINNEDESDPNIVYVEVAVTEPSDDLRFDAELEVDAFLAKHPKLLPEGAR